MNTLHKRDVAANAHPWHITRLAVAKQKYANMLDTTLWTEPHSLFASAAETSEALSQVCCGLLPAHTGSSTCLRVPKHTAALLSQ
eukprot:360642-Chlamydomonas_euryale.AAC.3